MSLDSPIVFMAVFCAIVAAIGALIRSRTVVLVSIGLFACWAMVAITILAFTEGGASG